MGKNIYSQAFSYNTHHIFCRKRFVCGSFKCPDEKNLSKFLDSSNFPCFKERFNQNKAESTSYDYIQNEWKEANKITWREVFSFKDEWLSILFIIFISIFLTYMLIFFAKLP